MITDFPADQDLAQALRPLLAYRPVVETDLLLSRLLKNARVAHFLAPYDLTYQVATREICYDLEDDGITEPGTVEMVLHPENSGSPVTVSATTAAALDRCATRPSLIGAGEHRSALDVLAALLDDPDCRAVAYLTEVGADVAELRESVRAGQPVVREDTLPEQLRPARDALLGRRRYRPRELGQFWTSVLTRVLPMNPARHPSLWARLEAGDLAEQHGGKTRTDDLLLAILITHAVAEAYPRLTGPTMEESGAGPLLVRAGLDHATVRAVIDSTDLGVDAVPLKKQMKGFPVGTGELLRRLVSEPDNRAVRLLQVLGVNPATLRPDVCV